MCIGLSTVQWKTIHQMTVHWVLMTGEPINQEDYSLGNFPSRD